MTVTAISKAALGSAETYIFNAEMIAIAISVIAIIISLITWFRSHDLSKKIAEKTLNQKLFEQIFFEKMLKELPSAFNKIEFKPPQSVSGIEEMNALIWELLEESVFYKYFDRSFYNKVLEMIIKLDDLTGIEMIDKDGFYKKRSLIDQALGEFYQELRKYYSGI